VAKPWHFSDTSLRAYRGAIGEPSEMVDLSAV
jgi:hypothetical protein